MLHLYDPFIRDKVLCWYTGATKLVKTILDSVFWVRKWTGSGRTFALRGLTAAGVGGAGTQRTVRAPEGTQGLRQTSGTFLKPAGELRRSSQNTCTSVQGPFLHRTDMDP